MTMAAFLGGAKSRLLPMSVPFRFFAAAALFHVLMWATLLTDAGNAVSFHGGFGPTLASIHLLTLGVLTMTAAGASVQLLPVATRRPIAAVWPIKLLFWILTPGLIILVSGMYLGWPAPLATGSGMVTVALVLLAILLGDNLRRSRSLPVVSAFGWAALVSLVSLTAFGIALIADYEKAILPDHGAAALVHLILAGFGFMGLLAIGFSYVLVPMFSLAGSPNFRLASTVLALAVGAILMGTVGAWSQNGDMLLVAAFAGLAACSIHLVQMRGILKSGMRKRLGLSFVLVHIAWAMIPLCLCVGIAALGGYAGRNGITLFGFLLLFGWLLTFLLAILQRILPFLASMHAVRAPGQMPPQMSALSSSWPLQLHAACHLAALATISIAIVLDHAILGRVGIAAGLLGSLAFLWFTADVVRRATLPQSTT